MIGLSKVVPQARLSSQAGIAIGPILFIIAVLGILAAAISAGSGSFSTSTTGESHKAKAVALIDIGQHLKIGFERIVGNGVAFSTVNIDPADTTATTDLFAPSGGGITSPSTTMSLTGTDAWLYPLIAIPGIGSAAGNRVAMLEVAEGVCDEVNSKANAMAVGAAHAAVADVGDFTAAGLNNGATWPAAWDGKMTGCVENSNAASAGFYFYQVIGVQ